MRKFVAVILTVMFVLLGVSMANAWVTRAKSVKTDVTNFGGHLSSTEINVQLALDILDDIAAGGDVTGSGDCADGACGDGSADGGTYYRLYDGSSHYGELQCPSVAGNVVFTIPAYTLAMPTADGTSGWFLKTNADGTTSWAVASGSGTVTTVEVGDVQVGGADIVIVDFNASAFDVTNVSTEINVDLDLTPSSGNATLVLTEDALQVKYDTTDFGETSDGLVLGASPTIATSLAFGAEAADAGAIRLSNDTDISWENSTPGTDIVGISVDASQIVQIAESGASGVTITPATTITGILTTGSNIELGHASDTTIARSGAGAITVEGVVVSLLGATIGASEVDADVATQAELDAVAALVDTDDEIIAIINASPGTQISVAAGGSGAGTFTDGGVLLGSGTGAFTALAALGDGEMIVGDGTTDPVAESGTTLRTSIGVGTGDSPQFTGIELGHASDTTIVRSAAGAVTIEAQALYVADDVPGGELGGTFASFTIDDSLAVTSWTLTTPVVTGGATFTDADIDPTAPGMLVYDNAVTGYGDGLFAWYDDDEIRYVVDFEASDLPGAGEDDYVLAYDADADKNYWKADADAGGAPVLEDVQAPTGAWAITLQDTENITWTTETTATDFLNIEATGAFGDISIVKIEQKTGNATDGDLLHLVTADADVDQLLIDFAGTDYVTHKVVTAGTYTIDVTSDATASVAFVDPVSITGAVTNITTLGLSHTAPGITLEDTDDAAGTGNLLFASSQATRDIVATIQVDINNSAVTFLTLDGTNEKITLGKYLDTFELGHASDTTISRSAAGDLDVEGVTVLLEDASIPLGANWDVGAYMITAAVFLPDTAADATGEIGFTGGAYNLYNVDDSLTITNAANVWTFGSTGDTFTFTPAVTFTAAPVFSDAPNSLVALGVNATEAEIDTPLDGASVTLTEFQELETIDATTISANQWAALGGIAETLTSTELDTLDGIAATLTAAEINILDGVTGVTAAELSYIGDVTGAIQAQIDGLGGDITAVGPGFASGAAFTDGVVSTGTSLFVWEGTTDDTVEFIIAGPADPTTADSTVTFREASGTVLISGDTLTGHATATFDTDGSTATTVVDFALNTDADVGDADIKSVDGLYGVDDQIYLDMGTQGKAILAADSTVEILVSDEDISFADGGADLINVASGSGTATVDFGTINLATDALDLSEGDISNVGIIKADELEPDAVANGSLIVQGGQTNANTLKLQGYDVDGTAYTDVITITSANLVTMALSTSDWNIDATGAITGVALDQDGTGNSITNIADASIKAAAAIDATKIGGGAVSTAEFNFLSTVTEDIQVAMDANAPDDATYILQTADGELANGQALGVLASGIMYSTTSTGAITIATEAQLETLMGLGFGASKVATSGYILVADGTDFESVVMSADATIAAGGAVTVVDDSHAHVYSNIDATTSANWIGRVSDETGTGKWCFATAPTFTTSIAFNAVTDTVAGIQNQNLVDKSAAEAISGAWETQDDIAETMGNDADWARTYDETTSNRLEYTHTAGADADVYWDLNDNAADSTYTIANSDGTYEANLVVDGNITSSSTGDSYLQLTNNSSGLTPSGYRLYVDNAEWYFSENGAEELVLTQEDGATLTGTTWDFSSVTNLKLPTAAADASGEISMSTGNQLIWHDGTKVITIDTTPTNDNFVLKYDNASATFTLEADETGGTPAWNSVTAPTADVNLIHDAGEETQFTYTGNFSTGAQFNIEQLTGNPTGGILLQVKAADANVTAARLGDGTNYTQISQAGNLTLAGTAQITAGAIIMGDTTPDSAGEIGFATNAFKFFGANSEDLSINVGTAANSCTITSNTSVSSLDIQIATLVADAFTTSGLITGGTNLVIADAGNIGSVTDTDAIAISSAGVIALSATTEASAITTAALTVAGGLGVSLDVWIGDDLVLDSDLTAIKLGADQEITLTHVADTGIQVELDDKIMFGDTAVYIHSDDDGYLDIEADTGIRMDGPVDMQANALDCDSNTVTLSTIAGTLSDGTASWDTSTQILTGFAAITNTGHITIGDDLIAADGNTSFIIKSDDEANDNIVLQVADTDDGDLNAITITAGAAPTLVLASTGNGSFISSAGTVAIESVTFTGDAISGVATIDGTAALAATSVVIDGTDTTSFVAIFDSATGSLPVKTDGALLYNAGTGQLQTTIFYDGTASMGSGSLTGVVGVDASGTVSANLLTPDAADSADIGTVDLEFSDLYLGASAVIYGELDQANSITSSGTGWTFALDITVSGGNINTGAVALVVGDASTTSIQLLTDGTGDAEVALPNDSIGPAEILTDAVTMDSVDADGAFTSLTGAWATTGLLSGGVVTKVAGAAYTIGTTNAAECYGGVIYVTGAAVITYPAVLAGMHFTIITVGAVAVSGKPNASDLQYLDGTALDDADKVTNTSGTGDLIVVTYYDGTGWWTISGSNDGDPWTDTGA